VAKILVAGDYAAKRVGKLLKERGHEIAEYDGWDESAVLESGLRDTIEVVLLTAPLSQCSARLVEGLPRLKGIVCTVIGTETIDVIAAHRRGIPVGIGAFPENVIGLAEAIVMLIAALSLDLPGKQKITRQSLPRPPVLKARLVWRRQIGLIGLGRIARAVIERMSGWGTSFVAHDPFVELPAPPNVNLVSLEALLQESDFVVPIIPLNNGTRNMIGAPQLALMKPGSYLINLSRGGIVDETALYDCLQEGRIAGAAVDVYASEPPSPSHPLRLLDNVIMTTHMAGHSRDMSEAFAPSAAESVERVLQGLPPLYVFKSNALHHHAVNPDTAATVR
jgi:D-3-phosphoglycerate dehydrogenase / 2-oxoglutarate reductase